VALQGSIETFALPDVVRLLASTKKTGRLRLSGSRGSGSLWVADGQVVAGEAGTPPSDGAADVLFEMLRFADGEFVFDADELPERLAPPQDVEPLLAAAEERLSEWREIEAVVPSLQSWVTLTQALTSSEVTIDADCWSMIVRVGHGTSVGALGEQFGVSELDVSRRVKDLVERGLVEIGGDAPAAFLIERRSGTAPEAEPFLDDADGHDAAPEPIVDEPVVDEDGRSGPLKLTTVRDPLDPAPDGDFEPFDPDGLVLEPAHAPVAEMGAEGPGDATDAAEVARQLANLSPKAAKAVAAAAKATTAEERERALAEVDDTEDVNRDLLVKFLGSVDG
jgi:hypothetical protein